MRRLFRFLLRLSLCLTMLALLGVAAVELLVRGVAAGHCHREVQACRRGDVAVVLGCSQYLRRGQRNAYFTQRMQAAAELWRSGRLRCIIVSGDNREKYYNEPRDMKAALVKLGVPESRIVCDYAGLRTYDSVVRAKRVFGADKVTFISQPEHTERAVTIARRMGIDAEGYAAKDVVPGRMRTRQWLRERLARLAMLTDLMMEHDPAHLGEPVKLPD